MSKGSGPPSERGDQRDKMHNVPFLKDAFWPNVNKEIVSRAHFEAKPKDNFIFQTPEHGTEKFGESLLL